MIFSTIWKQINLDKPKVMKNGNRYTFYVKMLRNESDLKFEDNWGSLRTKAGAGKSQS